MYTINDFEKANPGYRFKHFHMDDNRQVLKVIGHVRVNKKTFVCGKPVYVESNRKVRWDKQGHCYSVNNNNRLRDYDIPLR